MINPEETVSGEIWRERYYELESALEQALLGFEKILTRVEKQKSSGQRVQVDIYRITQVDIDGQRSVCCVANGINMEYKFEFFAGKELVHLQDFGRLNSANIPSDKSPNYCKVTLKSHVGKVPKIQSKEIKL